MPIFLDQSLRKAVLSKIRDSLGRDELLSGKIKVLDQETFLPEAENQIILTDIQVANESLDASNRVTELQGTVTFAPLKKPETSFLFWAQENPHQKQILSQGFYHLKLTRPTVPVSGDVPDLGWVLNVAVLKRVTEARKPWLGLMILMDSIFPLATDIDISQLVVKQNLEISVYEEDYQVIDTSIILRRYDPYTEVWYNGVDVTDGCNFADLVSDRMSLRTTCRPIQFRPTVLLNTVAVFNLTLNRPVLIDSYTITRSGVLQWRRPVKAGTEILIQYYEKKPLKYWELPGEFTIPLEAQPLIYASGLSALGVISSVRGMLPESAYVVKDSVLKVIEPVPQESIKVDYRYLLQSLGPVPVSPASIDDQILPGLSLTFTDNFIEGDEAVIIKHDQNKAIGQENGGTNKVELSLKLRSADDRILERMTSRVFFLFTDQNSLMELSNQGISLENQVSYARSYEERDGNSEKWLVNTFRLIVHHTWRYLIPYVTDLNSISVSTGVIEASHDTGSPTFRDLVISTTPNTWIQSY